MLLRFLKEEFIILTWLQFLQESPPPSSPFRLDSIEELKRVRVAKEAEIELVFPFGRLMEILASSFDESRNISPPVGE